MVAGDSDGGVAEVGGASGDHRLDWGALVGEIADEEGRPVVGVGGEGRQCQPVGVDV